MKGVKLDNRKQAPLNSHVEAAKKVVTAATDESILILAERAAERNIEGLQAGLDLQIKNFPLAESELRNVTRPWIDKARLELTTLRETGVTPTSDMDEVISQTKQRSWEQWVAISHTYPELNIVDIHDEECAQYDVLLAKYHQDLAEQEADHLNRMSAIRNAILEGALGEISPDEYLRKVTDQI